MKWSKYFWEQKKDKLTLIRPIRKQSLRDTNCFIITIFRLTDLWIFLLTWSGIINAEKSWTLLHQLVKLIVNIDEKLCDGCKDLHQWNSSCGMKIRVEKKSLQAVAPLTCSLLVHLQHEWHLEPWALFQT